MRTAQRPLPSWGCSPWSSATATSTARGSGRGSALTKRNSRGPTSSSKSSLRTGRTSSLRRKVSGDAGADGLRRGEAGGEPLSAGDGGSCVRGQQPEERGIHSGPAQLSRNPGGSLESFLLEAARRVPIPAPAALRRRERAASGPRLASAEHPSLNARSAGPTLGTPGPESGFIAA